ncbi:Kynurenine formamidase [Pseudonocardia thermophila]|uniref:Kynurenine formamidase n=1 Tax=Pseudonocardia thermophila TaxID=1848 RepID=A0A1M6XM85_PSETH|nr:cyclase family protein [Pseudonocardia thermophila]SHL07016.1 Kynurenine formamidase [Pseudonocardia thermophila]
MKIYDLTLPIHPDMLHWGKKPEIHIVESIERGDASNVTRWLIGAHTGTHVDAPHHFVNGAQAVDEIELETLVGQTAVVDMLGVEGDITVDDLEAAGVRGKERVLFKTTNSAPGGPLHLTEKVPDWVGVTPDAAQWIVDNGVKLVGIDYLTIEAPSHTDTWKTHDVLLRAGVIIVENLVLTDVPAQEHFMVCLPAKLKGADGAFARTVLIDQD